MPLGLLTPVLTSLLVATAPTSMRVAEVAYDVVGSEPDGEWVELINMDPAAVVLDGLRLADEETIGGNEAVLAFPAGATVEGFGVIVVAVNATAFQAAWGFAPDFEVKQTNSSVPSMTADRTLGGTQFQLANSSDEVLLLDDTGAVLDGVSWGRTTPLPGITNVGATREGQTISRIFDVAGPPRPWTIGASSVGTVRVIGLGDDTPAQQTPDPRQSDPPPDSVDPDPTDPDPVEPEPVEPDPVEPDPVEPEPIDDGDAPTDPIDGPPVADNGDGVVLDSARGGFSGPVTPESDGGCAQTGEASVPICCAAIIAGLGSRRRRR